MVEAGVDTELRGRGADPAPLQGHSPQPSAPSREGDDSSCVRSVRRIRPSRGDEAGNDGLHIRDKDGTDVWMFGQGPEEVRPYTDWQEVLERLDPAESAECVADAIAVLEELGVQWMTAVQRYSLPLLFRGSSLQCQAPTGTGKTLCFLLPALPHILANRRAGVSQPGAKRAPAAIFVTASTAVAWQTYSLLKKLTRRAKARVMPLFVNSHQRLRTALQSWLIPGAPRHVDAIVCTPLMLARLLRKKGLLPDLSGVRFVAVDEADRAVEMPPLRSLFLHLAVAQRTLQEGRTSRPAPQLTFWGATQSKRLRQFIGNHVPHVTGGAEAVRLQVGSEVLAGNVSHKLILCATSESLARLAQMFKGGEIRSDERVFIHARRPDSLAEQLRSELLLDGTEVAVYSSALPKEKQHRALQRFKSGVARILIADPSLARGWDGRDVDVAVLVAVPESEVDWIHVVGRCGRGGRRGRAVSLFTERDLPKVPLVLRWLRRAYPNDPVWTGGRDGVRSGGAARQLTAVSAESVAAEGEDEGGDDADEPSGWQPPPEDARLDIPPSLLRMAERMEESMKVLGHSPEHWKVRATRGVDLTPPIDALDPQVRWRGAPNVAGIKRRAEAYVKHTEKAKLQGHFDRQSRQLIGRLKQSDPDRLEVVGVRDKSTMHHEQVAARRQLRQMQELRQKEANWVADYRSKQLAEWRKRVGLESGAEEPPSYAPSAPRHAYHGWTSPEEQVVTVIPGRRMGYDMRKGRRGVSKEFRKIEV